MSVFGRIQFAVDVNKHNKQMRNYRDDRKAGSNNIKKAESKKPYNNTTDNHHKNYETSKKETHTPPVEPEKQKQEVKKDETNNKSKPETKKNEKKLPRTEQQVKAEAEAPVEKSDVHKKADVPVEKPNAHMKAEGTVNEMPPANMGAGVHIAEPQPGVINLGGVMINAKDVMERPASNYKKPQYSYDPTAKKNIQIPEQQNPAQANNMFIQGNPVQQQAVPVPQMMQQPMVPQVAMPPQMMMQMYPPQMCVPSMQNPIPQPMVQQPIPQQIFNPTGGPAIPQNAFNINHNPAMDIYTQRMMQQQNMPGVGNHKVDTPPEFKPPKPPKAEPDVINMDGMPDMSKAMDIQPYEVIDARTYGILEDKLPKNAEKIKLTSVFPNNKNMIKKYPYLEDVENVALDNGYQIAFSQLANGLIGCQVADEKGNVISNKGFTIDPGYIIDRRKKVFAGLFNIFEGLNAYPLFINVGGGNGKKSSNVFNEKLIADLIVGGNQTVEGVRGMYTEEFRNLNSIVELITIPTKYINSNDRKYIQNRLVSLYQEGVFDEALALNPCSRFKIDQFDSASGTIILDNFGMVKNFGGEYMGQNCIGEHIQFKITKDKCKMLRGENLIQTQTESE